MKNGDEFSDIDDTLRYFAGGPRTNWTGKVRCTNPLYNCFCTSNHWISTVAVSYSTAKHSMVCEALSWLENAYTHAYFLSARDFDPKLGHTDLVFSVR